MSVIAVPLTLFGVASTDTFNCRFALDGTYQPSDGSQMGVTNSKIGCRCALTAVVFDGFSWFFPSYVDLT